jgi:hypothetical protein
LKLISTSGVIASKNNCPAAGQFMYNTCEPVDATDASGTSWPVSAPAQAFTNGNCGYTLTVGQPTYGECGFPPSGWSVSWQPSYLTVDPIYWSHPSNPQAGQLAYAGGQFVYSSSNTYVTNWPETYIAGYQKLDGEVFTEITGVDGWRLRITFSAWNNWYEAIEDDLTP